MEFNNSIEKKVKFLILTPAFCAAEFLPATFDSILLQAKDDVDITYKVCDGASVDGTLDVINAYKSKFMSAGIKFSYASEKDFGMYDALTKGFLFYKNEEFDVYTYLNAGDRYAPRAFSKVAFLIGSGVDWLTGINILYNSCGDIIGAKLPGCYPKRLISVGLFGSFLPFIQQESTFWSGRAHELLDFDILRKIKLAGDFYIWKSFSVKFRLHIVPVWLSGFTIQPGQLSEIRRAEYFQELKSISLKRNILDYIFAVMIGVVWLFPDNLKKKLFKKTYVDF